MTRRLGAIDDLPGVSDVYSQPVLRALLAVSAGP